MLMPNKKKKIREEKPRHTTNKLANSRQNAQDTTNAQFTHDTTPRSASGDDHNHNNYPNWNEKKKWNSSIYYSTH